MASNILTEKELSNSAYSHIIHAPNEKVDIAAWLFTPPEAKYCRCGPPDHISCAATTTDDGKKMITTKVTVFNQRKELVLLGEHKYLAKAS